MIYIVHIVIVIFNVLLFLNNYALFICFICSELIAFFELCYSRISRENRARYKTAHIFHALPFTEISSRSFRR